MGGYGSGQYRRNSGTFKATVEQQLSLSIKEIKPHLTPKQERVSIKLGKTSLDIELTWTDCNYGGQRPWFICPKCDRRVGTVYQKIFDQPKSTYNPLAELGRERLRALHGWPIPPRHSPIGCRECLNLNYESQQVSKGMKQRQLKLEKIQRKLGVLRSFWVFDYDFVPTRPKGMSKKTYARLLQEYEQLCLESCREWEARQKELEELSDKMSALLQKLEGELGC